MLNEILAHDIDLAESIVELVHESEPMMFITFVEDNPDYSPLDILMIATALLAKGEAKLDTGNGTTSTLKLVKINTTADRGIELPEFAA